MKISIRKDTKQRINAFAAYTDENGTRYPTVPPEVFEWVEPPAPPAGYLENPSHYYVTEQDDAPFVVYTRKADEQIAEATLAKVKADRITLVNEITVTTTSGKTFDGNEDAQRRMTSAITAMDEADTIPWVLVDNSVAVVGRTELREALRLAGAAMAAIWVAPYTQP